MNSKASPIENVFLSLGTSPLLDNTVVLRSHGDYRAALEQLLTPHISGSSQQINVALPVRATSYLPVLLADAYGITDESMIRDVSLAHHYTNHFAHLIDFQTDEAIVYDPTLLHISILVHAKATAIYGQLSHPGDQFWWRWEQYLNESSVAERSLWRHRDVMVPYHEVDLHHMGQKSALLKTTAAIYASVTDNWNSLDQLELGLNKAFLAVQLLDDLFDWESDLSRGIYSYPLWLASSGSSLNPMAIGTELLLGHIAESVIALASDELLAAQAMFRSAGASALADFTNGLDLSLVQILTNIQEDADAIVQCPSAYDIRKYIRTIIDPRLAH